MLLLYEFPHSILLSIHATFLILKKRVKQCLIYIIRREIVSLWAGDKADSSITTTVYTHFQERSELQLKEIVKYDYEY